jgi:outer membrane protein OmpA-like peptidoglycan-associated protein
MKTLKILSVASLLLLTAVKPVQSQELSTDEITRRLGGVPAEPAAPDAPKTRGFAQHPAEAAAPAPVTPPAPKFVISDMTVHFSKGSSALSPDSYPQLQKLAQALKSGLTGVRIGIVGRTDASGSDDFNMKLSRDRATEVASYLIKQGSVDPSVLYVQGLGKSQASASDLTGADGRVVEIQRLN